MLSNNTEVCMYHELSEYEQKAAISLLTQRFRSASEIQRVAESLFSWKIDSNTDNLWVKFVAHTKNGDIDEARSLAARLMNALLHEDSLSKDITEENVG